MIYMTSDPKKKRFINTKLGKVLRFPLIIAFWLLVPIPLTLFWWVIFWGQFGITELVTEDW
jgi:hypothetical protein